MSVTGYPLFQVFIEWYTYLIHKIIISPVTCSDQGLFIIFNSDVVKKLLSILPLFIPFLSPQKHILKAFNYIAHHCSKGSCTE